MNAIARSLCGIPKHSKIKNILAMSSRCYAMKDNCKIVVDTNTGIAVATLNRPPVNSLNIEMLKHLTSVVTELENDEKVKGLIITSGVPKIFSAGLDLNEIFNSDIGHVREIATALQNFWIKFYVSPLVTMAAINGSCPAGACLLALSCDYRVMTKGKHTIGISENQFGILVPSWFMEIITKTIGHRQTERAIQLGTLFDPEEALRIGLVDEVVEEGGEMEAATKEMKKWLKIPHEARISSKIALRQEAVDKLVDKQIEDRDKIVNNFLDENSQKTIRDYLKGLKNKK